MAPPLTRAALAADPVRQFLRWFAAARRSGRCALPEAMCLSTVDARGRPDARVVLLKEADAGGFVFYTNLHSPKARQLARHPRAALTFCWEPMQRQVRITGRVKRVSERDANAYFATRPRGSQLGAWASSQSVVLPDRAALECRFAAMERRYTGRAVPRPRWWGGLRVVPEIVEFWQARPDRLHDRFVYRRRGARWTVRRLSP